MAGHLGHTSTPLNQAAAFKDELAREMKGRFVGPLSPDDFLEEFLSVEGPEMPEVSPEAFSAVANGRTEHHMYDSFIRAISGFAPNAVAIDSSSAHNTTTLGPLTLKPDVSIYWKGNSPEGKGRKTRTDFSLMEMHVEFKKSDSDDAFEDAVAESGAESTDQNFEKDTQSGREDRGQVTAYALAQLSHQFRCFAFSLFVTGKFVRFIRWDRAGAVVSSRFDYTERPSLLAKLFWNYSHSSPEKRGIDTTVTSACFDNPEDEVRIRRILGLKNSIPLYRYEVPEDDQSRRERERDEGQGHPLVPYYYYGPMPPRPAMSLIGRSTRSLPVVDLNKKDDNEAHVYLKDAWRIDAPLIEKEGDIYRSLHAAKVPHIMPFERGNDVVTYGYKTQTQLIALGIWGRSRRALTGHIHYRMVLGVVGTALTSFSSSKQFVSTTRDALIAHTRAFEDANILHRDISPGNIVESPEGGYLIDWDLCKRLRAPGGSDGGTDDFENLDDSPRRRDRTGTWQFMSAMILLDRSKVQGRVDDLESFLHVLSWVPIRYLDNVMADDERLAYLKEVFDECGFRNNILSGGQQKRFRLMVGSYIPDSLAFKKPSPLLQLLKDIAEVFKWRYIEISEKDRQDFAALTCLVAGNPQYTDLIENSPVHKHDLAMKQLAGASWLLDALNHSLSSDFTWPEDDKASLSWLPVDATAPPVTYKKQLSHARTSELARAAAYASTGSSHLSRTSSKRGRPESSDDEQVKRPRN